MRTCFYITSNKVPNTFMTICNFIKNAEGKRKYHGCFYVNGTCRRKCRRNKEINRQKRQLLV